MHCAFAVVFTEVVNTLNLGHSNNGVAMVHEVNYGQQRCGQRTRWQRVSSSPRTSSSSSSMTAGRSRPARYDARENLNPGIISSVTAAPPTMCRRSSTVTSRPCLARYAADTRPLWPPPMTMTSRFLEPGPVYLPGDG